MNPFSPVIMHSAPDVQEYGHLQLQLHHPADLPANARKSKCFAEGTLATVHGNGWREIRYRRESGLA
jgi:hypothetical protein